MEAKYKRKCPLPHTCTSPVASTGVPATPTTFALGSSRAATPVASTPVVSTPAVSTPVASTLVPTATAFVHPVQPNPSVSGQIDKECYSDLYDDSDDELSELRGQVTALQLQNGDLINKVDRLEVMLTHVIKLLEPKNIPKNNRSKKPSAPTASAPTASSPTASSPASAVPTAPTGRLPPKPALRPVPSGQECQRKLRPGESHGGVVQDAVFPNSTKTDWVVMFQCTCCCNMFARK